MIGQKSSQKLNNQAGFTVLEVMITIFVIAVSLLVFQATAHSLTLNKQGRSREIALRIADKKLQTIRTTAFASIPASGSFSDPLLSTLPNGQGNIEVSNINSTLKDVAVTVSWTAPNGSTSDIELQTYVASGGIGQ